MTKFREGESVRVTPGEDRYNMTGMVGTVMNVDTSDNRDDYVVYSVRFEGDRRKLLFGYKLEHVIGGTMKVGDTLVNPNGGEMTVLGYHNQGVELYALSCIGDPNKMEDWYTATEIKDNGWKLKTDPQIKEVTLEDVAKKFGVDIAEIRVKD